MDFRLAYSSNIILKDIVIVLDDDRINNFLQNIVSKIKIDKLNDWTVIINIIYGNFIFDNNWLGRISIGKRGVLYNKDKEKWVAIGISIPTNEEVHYGINAKWNKPRIVSDTESKYQKYYKFNYNNYNNLSEYVENAIIFGLDNLFKNGITIKGNKITIE
jgi:hypothetical protein